MNRTHVAMLVGAVLTMNTSDPIGTAVARDPEPKRKVRVRIPSDFSHGKARGPAHPCTQRSWKRRRQRNR
jgi:hypothetical protein